jgi:hypothetical protein
MTTEYETSVLINELRLIIKEQNIKIKHLEDTKYDRKVYNCEKCDCDVIEYTREYDLCHKSYDDLICEDCIKKGECYCDDCGGE